MLNVIYQYDCMIFHIQTRSEAGLDLSGGVGVNTPGDMADPSEDEKISYWGSHVNPQGHKCKLWTKECFTDVKMLQLLVDIVPRPPTKALPWTSLETSEFCPQVSTFDPPSKNFSNPAPIRSVHSQKHLAYQQSYCQVLT